MNKHLKRTVILLICLTLILFSVIYFLPALLEIFLVSQITRNLPLTINKINIDSLSSRSLQGSIRLANRDQPVLIVSHFALCYSPLGLLKGMIDEVTIEGVSLHLWQQADGIRFNGPPIPESNTQKTANFASLLSILPRDISLQDFEIILHEDEKIDRQMRLDARVQLPRVLSDQQQLKRSGSLIVPKIIFQGKQLLSLKADLELTEKDLTVEGMALSPLLPDLRLYFSAASDANSGIMLKLDIPARPFATTTLAPLVTLPAGLQLDGKLSGKAVFHVGPKKTQAAASFQVQEGHLGAPENKIALEGINLSVDFPHLPAIDINSSQSLSIKTMNIGDLRFSDARVQFHFQDFQKIVIDKARFGWCGGHVETEDLIFSTAAEELNAVLSCNHLDISQLLAQIGINGSNGHGTLDGRLPLSLNRTGIRFGDGLLFSTPGEHGRLQFKETDVLRQGMPALNSSASLDYALDALKDISYSQLKLTIKTIDNDLRITMQIDGKPTVSLPYGYRDGQIVKDLEGPGIQHPILLDVNFHLPSAEVFQFGKTIQTIREKM